MNRQPRGYHAVADELVNENSLKAEFLKWSKQRHDFAQALSEEMVTVGVEPKWSMVIAGTMHRGWMTVRQAVASNKTQSILDECIRGEAAGLKAYHEAKLFPLLGSMNAVIQAQGKEMQRALDHLNSLIDPPAAQ